jgi:Flp pilus assembly protein TadG
MTGFVSLLRRFRADDSGQSLVIISLSMVVLLGMAALAIDVANWYTKHHQAQVVADSAALAAANCLAHPNVGVSGSSCSSSTDTKDATAVAIAYAAANGVTISGSQVVIDTSSDKVTVNAVAPTPTMFASVFGVHNTSETATAAASFKDPPGQPCGNPGQNCDFMFANSHNSNAGSYALNVAVQGSSTIKGGIQTNGNLNASATGNSGGVWGNGLYGPTGSGAGSTVTGNKDPWKTSPPYAEPSYINWPIDYSTDFPTCVVGGSGTNACQPGTGGTGGTPSYCTNASANITFTGAAGDQPQPGSIYCAYGTGTPSSPSTWNGAITINSSGNNTFDATFVGGSISYTGNGGDTISPCGYTPSGFSSATCGTQSSPVPAPATANYPVFYVVGADQATPCVPATPGSCALNVQSTGNLTLDGDVFVTDGTAALTFQGNQSAGNTFIEANYINAVMDGNFQGDGPTVSGSGGGVGGGLDYLVQ